MGEKKNTRSKDIEKSVLFEKLRPEKVQVQGPASGNRDWLLWYLCALPQVLLCPLPCSAQQRTVMGTGRECIRIFPWGPGMTQPDSMFKISQPHPDTGSMPLSLFPFFGQNLAEGPPLLPCSHLEISSRPDTLKPYTQQLDTCPLLRI